jgi:hypothetical protein
VRGHPRAWFSGSTPRTYPPPVPPPLQHRTHRFSPASEHQSEGLTTVLWCLAARSAAVHRPSSGWSSKTRALSASRRRRVVSERAGEARRQGRERRCPPAPSYVHRARVAVRPRHGRRDGVRERAVAQTRHLREHAPQDGGPYASRHRGRRRPPPCPLRPAYPRVVAVVGYSGWRVQGGPPREGRPRRQRPRRRVPRRARSWRGFVGRSRGAATCGSGSVSLERYRAGQPARAAGPRLCSAAPGPLHEEGGEDRSVASRESAPRAAAAASTLRQEEAQEGESRSPSKTPERMRSARRARPGAGGVWRAAITPDPRPVPGHAGSDRDWRGSRAPLADEVEAPQRPAGFAGEPDHISANVSSPDTRRGREPATSPVARRRARRRPVPARLWATGRPPRVGRSDRHGWAPRAGGTARWVRVTSGSRRGGWVAERNAPTLCLTPGLCR